MKLLPFPDPRPPATDAAADGIVLPFGPAAAPPDRWLIRPCRRPAAQLRIFCFPWSGASASAYRAHAEAAPAHIEIVAIQLPGRGTRRGEPVHSRLESPAQQIAQAVRADLRARPCRFAVLGHSYGALLAYETARRLEGTGLAPELAVLSASRAPSTPPHVLLHQLDDRQLARQLGRMGGMSPDRLHDPGFLSYLLPIARCDLTACETYAPAAVRPLTCPVTSWCGDQDCYARPADVASWRQYANSAYSHRRFRGGHFFINDVAAATRSLLADLSWSRSRNASLALPAA